MAKKKPRDEEIDSTDDAAAAMGSGSGSESSESKTGEIEDEPTQKLKAVTKEQAAAAAAMGSKKINMKELKETKAVPPPRRSSSGPRTLVPIICSECHGEGTDFVFDTGVASDSLTCPICEHQATRPNDADLARIEEKRKQEKTAFVISLVLALVGMVGFAAWAIVCRNPHTNAQEAGGLFYGPVAVSVLGLLGCAVYTIAKYEPNRHDVYF